MKIFYVNNNINEKIFTIRKINLILMILSMTMIISTGLVLFVLAMKWYFSMFMMIYLMIKIMVLNYECKMNMDQGLIDVQPSKIHKTLLRTFSKLEIFH